MKNDLDREVGELVFGYHLSRQNGRMILLDRHLAPVGINVGRAHSWKDCEGITAEQAWVMCPDFSSDIAAAWTVIEELRKRDLGFLIEMRISGGWAVKCPSWYQNEHWEDAETAPLAICKAAIRGIKIYAIDALYSRPPKPIRDWLKGEKP